jgi:hypothetical protein
LLTLQFCQLLAMWDLLILAPLHATSTSYRVLPCFSFSLWSPCPSFIPLLHSFPFLMRPSCFIFYSYLFYSWSFREIFTSLRSLCLSSSLKSLIVLIMCALFYSLKYVLSSYSISSYLFFLGFLDQHVSILVVCISLKFHSSSHSLTSILLFYFLKDLTHLCSWYDFWNHYRIIFEFYFSWKSYFDSQICHCKMIIILLTFKCTYTIYHFCYSHK